MIRHLWTLLDIVLWSVWGLFVFNVAVRVVKDAMVEVLELYYTNRLEFLEGLEQKCEMGQSKQTPPAFH